MPENFSESQIVHSDIRTKGGGGAQPDSMHYVWYQPHAPWCVRLSSTGFFPGIIGVYTERGGCMCGCAECVCVHADVHELCEMWLC